MSVSWRTDSYSSQTPASQNLSLDIFPFSDLWLDFLMSWNSLYWTALWVKMLTMERNGVKRQEISALMSVCFFPPCQGSLDLWEQYGVPSSWLPRVITCVVVPLCGLWWDRDDCSITTFRDSYPATPVLQESEFTARDWRSLFPLLLSKWDLETLTQVDSSSAGKESKGGGNRKMLSSHTPSSVHS